ncbi:MAG TPA: hypothetical protein VGO22_09845 [Pseudorhizobium sp.]|jgi:hypothetical protein|nr:hypothetical protein [Pseudorhizobium sp.]
MQDNEDRSIGDDQAPSGFGWSVKLQDPPAIREWYANAEQQH